MLKFQVTNGQGLWRTDKNIVSADTTDLKAQFELTADFTGTITVWWRRSDVNNTYTSTLAADGTCTIPAEALAATDKAVYGPYDHDVFVSISDTGRTTTNEYKLTVLRSAFSTNATPGTGGSLTAYEELVEQFDELKADNQTFKDDMTEQQETFESTVTENVDNIRYVVETETAPPIIEEASGAEITLDNSAYRQVRDLQLYGYSRQIQTTGAQLIDAANADWKKNNFSGNATSTFQRTETGIDFTVTYISASSGVYLYIFEIGKSYHISFDVLFSDTNFHNFRYGIDSIINVSEIQAGKRKHIESDIINADEKALVFYLYSLSTGTQVTIENLMISEGTESKPFEPYSGGYASPSPDWAQPITSVGDGGSVTVNSVGANLFPALDVQDVTSGGVTVRNNNDGSLTISGSGNLTRTISNLNKLNHAETVQRLKAGQYTISGAEPGHPYILTSYLYNNDINIEGNTQTSSESTIEISQDALNDVSSYIRFGLYGRSGSTITQQTVWPMFNRGSTPLPWEPYSAPSSALIALTDSLRGIPVTSGGTYTDDSGQQWIADYIYRRQTDGKWMIWRNCGRVEYIGGDDENWMKIFSGDGYPRFTTSSRISNALVTDNIRSKVICNRGLYHQTGNGNGYAFIASGPQFYFTLDPSIDSVDSFKTWLQSNPLEVVYRLATPTIEELPENVQAELNGLYTYNLHTDMWNDDGAYMNLKYVADTKTWINNKIAGLSTATLNQN